MWEGSLLSKPMYANVKIRNRQQICVCTGAAGISAYCGSKFAVRGFLDSLRLEVGLLPRTFHP